MIQTQIEKIKKLKELTKLYKISIDWEYNEKYTLEEYKQLMGDYFRYSPIEIVNDMCNYINELSDV